MHSTFLFIITIMHYCENIFGNQLLHSELLNCIRARHFDFSSFPLFDLIFDVLKLDHRIKCHRNAVLVLRFWVILNKLALQFFITRKLKTQ